MTDKETKKKAIEWVIKQTKENKPVWPSEKKKKMEAYNKGGIASGMRRFNRGGKV